MKKRLLMSPLLLALTGCTNLWFPYEKPATETPAAWREATATSTETSWPDQPWWELFGTPELVQLVKTAQEKNHDLGAAIARVRQANAQVTINGAPLLPTISAAADGAHTHAGSKTKSASGDRFNAKLNASYELDFWGKNTSALESAEASLSASEFDREVVRLTTNSSVATVYFDLLATHARLSIAHENLASAEQTLNAIRRRYEQGVANGLDVAQQESETASLRATIPPLELQRSKDLDALAILVGSLPESFAEPTATLSHLSIPTVPADLPSDLLIRRPDVQKAEANLMAAHANINQARAAFFPSISLTGQAGYTSNALSSLFKPGSMLTSYGANLAQPIFNNGALSGDLELSKGEYDEKLENYHAAVIAAFADTEDALAAVTQSAAQEKAQTNVVTAAKKAYTLAQQQFNGGIIDITTLLNTQRSLFTANDALVQAKLTHLQSIAKLYTSLGGGWYKPSK